MPPACVCATATSMIYLNEKLVLLYFASKIP